MVKSMPPLSPSRRIVCPLFSLFGVGGVLFFMMALMGCVSVKTEHRVEPIQITMDVNVRLERELEDAFGALDARSRKIAENHVDSEKGSE